MDDFAASSHYKYLLDDPEFRRFLQNVRRRSENSASELLRRFGMIHKRFHKLPADFAKMNTKKAKHFMLDMIEDFETKGGEDGEDLAVLIRTWIKILHDHPDYKMKKGAHKILQRTLGWRGREIEAKDPDLWIDMTDSLQNDIPQPPLKTKKTISSKESSSAQPSRPLDEAPVQADA